MSTAITKDIVCPNCGQTQKLELYTSVNAQENPELRRDILRESIFDWECRHCGYTAQMAYPTIYHDPELGFMVCLRPSGAVSKPETIPAVKELIKRSVKNPQELKEKILIFEAGLDDAAIELVKNKIGVDFTEALSAVDAYQQALDNEEQAKEDNRSFDVFYSFKKAIKNVQEEIQKLAEERTIVVIVDELDRCLPSYAIKVLERLHHLFTGIENVSVVLGMIKVRK